MAIGVTPPTINGPPYPIHCARGWTARQRRLLRYSGGEASGAGKSLESRQAWSLSRWRRRDRGKLKRSGRDSRNTGGASESWTRVENQGRWAQWGVTRVSSVPLGARSFARTRGMTATWGNTKAWRPSQDWRNASLPADCGSRKG